MCVCDLPCGDRRAPSVRCCCPGAGPGTSLVPVPAGRGTQQRGRGSGSCSTGALQGNNPRSLRRGRAGSRPLSRPGEAGDPGQPPTRETADPPRGALPIPRQAGSGVTPPGPAPATLPHPAPRSAGSAPGSAGTPQPRRPRRLEPGRARCLRDPPRPGSCAHPSGPPPARGRGRGTLPL